MLHVDKRVRLSDDGNKSINKLPTSLLKHNEAVHRFVSCTRCAALSTDSHQHDAQPFGRFALTIQNTKRNKRAIETTDKTYRYCLVGETGLRTKIIKLFIVILVQVY